jgi:hypothetical protein
MWVVCGNSDFGHGSQSSSRLRISAFGHHSSVAAFRALRTRGEGIGRARRHRRENSAFL